jgi:cell division protein FtsL
MSARGVVLALLFLAAIASAIGVVQVRHEGRQRYIDLRALNAERDELDVEYGRLQLEQATWAEMSRVERIARDDLRLVRPDPREITVVRR